MFSLLPSSVSVQKFACRVLLVLIVFQLGACPCGCLEHNAWVQMLGLSSHHDHHLSEAETDQTTIEGSDHDCNGRPGAVYFNNAISVNADHAYNQGNSVAASCGSLELLTVAILDSSSLDSCRFRRTYAPSLSALQVYQL